MKFKKLTPVLLFFLFLIFLGGSVYSVIIDLNSMAYDSNSLNYVTSLSVGGSGGITSSTTYQVSPLVISSLGVNSGMNFPATDTNGDANSANYFFTPGFVGAFLAHDENLERIYVKILDPAEGTTIGCSTAFSLTWMIGLLDTNQLDSNILIGGFKVYVDEVLNTSLSASATSTSITIGTTGTHTLRLEALGHNQKRTKSYSRGITIGACGNTGSNVNITSAAPSGGGEGGAGEEEEEEPVVSEEIVFEQSISSEDLTVGKVDEVMDALESEPAAVEAAIKLMSGFPVSLVVTTTKFVYEDKIEKYKTTVALVVENNSDKDAKDIYVIAEIPKSVAENALDISSDDFFTVLKEDPVLQFVVDELKAGESATLSYTVEKKVDEESSSGLTAFTASVEEVAGLCDGVKCTDEPCRKVSCNSATGKCTVKKNKADSTSCGVNKECKSGACVETPAPLVTGGVTGEEKKPVDYTMLGGIVVLIILLGVIYFFVTQKKPKKKGLSGV